MRIAPTIPLCAVADCIIFARGERWNISGLYFIVDSSNELLAKLRFKVLLRL